MTITVNGDPLEVEADINVQQLVEKLGFGERRLAVELNRDVIRRDTWTDRQLAENDIVEIVQFVGGG